MSDIEEKLKNAADKVEVPDMLSPDVMRLRLDARERRSEKEAGRTEDVVSLGGRTAKISGNDEADAADFAKELSDKADAAKAKKQKRQRMLATAAAAVLLVGVSYFLTYEHFEKQLEKAGTSLEEVASNAKKDTNVSSETERETFVRHDAGTMFTVAKTERAYTRYVKDQLAASDLLSFSTDGVKDSAATDSAVPESAADDTASAQSGADSYAGGGDYSETNTVVEGVDEADIVKTDGKYIYRVVGEAVKVTKADGTALTRCDDINVVNDTIAAVKNTGTDDANTDSKDADTKKTAQKEGTARVSVPAEVGDVIGSSAVTISEMFVKDNKLIIFGSLWRYSGLSASVKTYDRSTIDTTNWNNNLKLLAIFTYDISDPEDAVLTGVNCIDGQYNTARITSDGLLVVFAYNWIEEKDTAWPAVDGQKLSADSIYLPVSGRNQTIIATYDMTDSGLAPVDSCMVVNDYCEEYVTDDAIYLYSSAYTGGADATNVARFILTDGHVDAAGAATVTGEVTDPFALRVAGDNLFILTTAYADSGETSNGLYVYGADMQRRGALTGLAPGEQIYSARYIGNISYFVTYRQIDPLFAVDISNPDEPKLLGYLKITGFSDYLHPWSDNRLLGIGEEVDPVSNESKGIKLTMFDISDPSNPTDIGSTVVPMQYVDLYIYDYRGVLASADRNIIGFSYSGQEGESSNWKYWYSFFSWNEETKTFDVKYRVEDTFEGIGYQNARGLYIGDNLYVAGPSGIDVQGGEKLLY